MNKIYSNFPRRALFHSSQYNQGYNSAGNKLKQELFIPVILCKTIPRIICFGVCCFVINPSQSPDKEHIFVTSMCDVVAYPY